MKTKIAIATVAVALGAATNATATNKDNVLFFHGIECITASTSGINAIICGRPSHPKGARIGITSGGTIMVVSNGHAVTRPNSSALAFPSKAVGEAWQYKSAREEDTS